MTQTSRLDCQEKTVYKLLNQLVAIHRTEPNARLVKQAAGRRAVLKCPRFFKIMPDHGPAEGGYPIRLEGVNLPRVVGVNFGHQRHLTAVSEDGRTIVITAPAANNPDAPLAIWPDGMPSAYDPYTYFSYDPPNATTQSSTSSTRPPAIPPTSKTAANPSSSSS
jgi:hypothetical protein